MVTTIPIIDWVIVGLYIVGAIVIGMVLSKKATHDISSYFVSGRNLPWWLLGTSMVATTFAADTPLAVSGLVISQGIAGNWYWWAGVFSGMLGVFLYSHLWRRSKCVTDTELIELRYSGKEAAFLRGFRAVYFSIVYNCIVMGWVNLAMAKILSETLGLPKLQATGLCFITTVIYTASAGLWGVVVTDFFQFAIAMFGAIIMAIIVVSKIGGMNVILSKLPEIYGVQRATDMTKLIPIDSALLPFSFFLIYIGLQWWSTGNTDGGGYFAQRMLAAKNELHAKIGYLWGNIAHYILRSWPWVICGLAAAVVYYKLDPQSGKLVYAIGSKVGQVADPEVGYIRLMIDFLPSGMLGLMLASFVAAYMSTIDTQLNWGAGYLINDFYKRFIVKNASEKHYVTMSIIATVFIALCGAGMTLLMSSISGAWFLLTAINAGIGVVYLLRWYWWRVSAYSEIAAMATAFLVAFVLFKFTNIRFPISLLYSVPISLVVWLTVTFLTPPVKKERLIEFYKKVRPGGPGWKKIAKEIPGCENDKIGVHRFIGWFSGVVAVYGIMLGVGDLLLHKTSLGIVLLVLGIIGFYGVYRCVKIESQQVK
jgi:SSS family transporter